MRLRALIVLTFVVPLSGCAELAGAAIDAGFRKALDHGSHPLYEHKSYGEHFVDSLLEEETPHEVDVTVTYEERRRHR